MERSRNKKATLYTFLQDHKTEKGSAFTHTSIYCPVGSFYVTPEETDRFLQLYKEAMLAGEDLYLTEKHREVGPVVVDLDFRFDKSEDSETETPTRKYTHQDINDIVVLYAGLLSEWCNTHESIDAYILEKDAPVYDEAKGCEKDGVHIVFPKIVTTPMFQLYLRKQILERLDLSKLKCLNSLEDIVDEAVIERNGWQMLGSKKPHSQAYRVTKILSYSGSDVVTTDVSTDLKTQADLVEVLSIRNKYIETEVKGEVAHLIKLFANALEASKMKSHFKNTILCKTRNCKNNFNDDDFKQAGILVDMLSVDRAESYYDWIRVGWCLRNIDYRLLDAWISFSKKSSKFKDGECERMWNYMRQDGACLGMGTLHLWAKSDNAEAYGKHVDTELRVLIRDSVNGSEFDIARVIQRKYNHIYAYDTGNKQWFHFHDHRWHISHDGLALKRKLPTEIANEYRKSAAYFNTLAQQCQDEPQKNVLDDCASNLQKIVNKLKRAAFQACVMTECAMLFAIDRFEERLDSNRNLIGFENGVYDLDAVEFRDGRPEDFISLSTGINYVDLEHANNLQDIKAFLGQVIPNDGVREYVLRLLASFLHGEIREERFHVWTGSGSNGKSKWLELYQKAFGDYCCTLPIALLTQKRGSSSSASPELARVRSKRFACLQEPGENERLNIGLMKEMTGGDKLYARGLYKEGMEFKPQFKMILTCNHLPLVPSDDGGTWRRIRVVRFESKFTENPDPAKPNEFPIDTSLSQKFGDWAEGLMSLLIEYYKKVITEGKIKEPDEVLECTREYQRRNDIIADFLDYAVVKDDSGFLQLGEAFNDFKSWLKEEGCTDRSMRKSDFQSYIEKVYGKAVSYNKLRGWKGYKLKSSIMDVIDDDDD